VARLWLPGLRLQSLPGVSSLPLRRLRLRRLRLRLLFVMGRLPLVLDSRNFQLH